MTHHEEFYVLFLNLLAMLDLTALPLVCFALEGGGGQERNGSEKDGDVRWG